MEPLQIIILITFIITTGVFAGISYYQKPKLFPELQSFLNQAELETGNISGERKVALDRMRDYALQRMYNGKQASFLFICTENCGRSIMAQVWLEVMARQYDLPQLLAYSGGTQPEPIRPEVVQALEESGIQVKKSKGRKLSIRLGQYNPTLTAFSKFFDDVANPQKNFAAITTDDFTERFLDKVTGAQQKISLLFGKPDSSDEMDKINLQIAGEMMYLATQVKRALDPMFIQNAAVKRATALKPVHATAGHTTVAA